jgi:hypothetical protein
VLIGAYATPEFTDAVPSVTVAVGVTVNVADAVFPMLSVAVTVCAPLVKSTDPQMVTTTFIEFVVPTSLDPTVPTKLILPTAKLVTVPVSVPAVVHAVDVVTATVWVTDCAVVEVTALIEPRVRVPPTAVPVQVTVGLAIADSDHVLRAVNWNTDVPCSVTVAGVGEIGDRVVLPILTLVSVALGPNPDSVAVTIVPTGPEAGESVTVAPVEVAP